MITAIKNSPISFKANYNLVDDKTIKDIIAAQTNGIRFGAVRMPKSDSIYADGIKTGYKISESTVANSTGFAMCNGFGFSNAGSSVTLSHVVPSEATPKYIKDINDSLDRDYLAISKYNKPVDILVAAGESYNKKSVALLSGVLPGLKSKNADLTVMWGSKPGHIVNLAYSALSDPIFALKDTYLINLSRLDLKNIKSVKDIQKFCFDLFEPGKNAKFFKMGKRIF